MEIILNNGKRVFLQLEQGGGSGDVDSVFGRTGNVVASEGDYDEFYPLLSSSYNNPSWINTLAYSKISGAPPPYSLPIASNSVLGGIKVGANLSINPVSGVLDAASGGSGITQLTGDVLAGPGSGTQAAALSTTGATPGSYGDTTHTPVITVDAKGRISAVSQAAIAGAGAAATSIPTASSLGILANGSDQTSAINTALANSNYAGIFFDFVAPAAVTISGTVVGQGKQLMFYPGSYLTGSGTVNNVLIGASLYEKVWDTTLTMNPINGTQGWVSANWAGAKHDAVTDDYAAVQYIFDMAMRNSTIRHIRFSGGVYLNATQGWLLWKVNTPGGNPIGFPLRISGYSTAYGSFDAGEETVMKASFINSFVLGIQRGKQVIVENISFEGTNQLNYAPSTNSGGAWNPSTTFIHGSERTNTFSPYCAIALDPLGPSVGSTDQYPGFSTLYSQISGSGGSTNCKFYNIAINGFVAGVVLSPNGTTLNNEAHDFRGFWINNCREGFVTCNGQERTVNCFDFKFWNSVQTCWSTRAYGAGRGASPNIQNFNVAGSIFQLFNISGNGIPLFSIQDGHAESFYRIGTIGSAMPMEIRGCNFHFAFDTIDSGFVYPNSVLTTTGAAIEFLSCGFFYFTGDANMYPMNIDTTSGGVVKFRGCILTADITATNTLSQFYDNFTVAYDNCTFYSTGWTVNSQKSFYMPSLSEQSATLQAVGFGSEICTYGNSTRGQQTFSQRRKVLSPLVKWRYITTQTITVSGNTATVPIQFSLGTKIRVQCTSGSLSGFVGPVTDLTIGVVTAWDGSVSTISYLVNNMVTGSYDIYVPSYTRIGRCFVGDLTSGSPNVTNVYGEIAATTSEISNSYYMNGFLQGVSSTGTNTVTMASSAVYTAATSTICPYEYEESGESWCDPGLLTANFGITGVLFTRGAFYRNASKAFDGTNVGWLCTKTGVLGSAAAPVFEAFT